MLLYKKVNTSVVLHVNSFLLLFFEIFYFIDEKEAGFWRHFFVLVCLLGLSILGCHCDISFADYSLLLLTYIYIYIF